LKQDDSCKYLKEVTQSLRFLTKKAQGEAYKRGLDVLSEVLALKNFANKKPAVQETRDISRHQFLMGVQRYLIGFYDDSIYYTTMSVEMGLLIRLDEELSLAQKEEIHAKINAKEHSISFTFGTIFGMCKKRGLGIIKGSEIAEKIDDIIATRNTHIHASNINSAGALSVKEISIPEISKGLKDIETIENIPAINLLTKSWLPKAKELVKKTNTAIINIDSLEWCTRDKERIRTKQKVDEFFNQIFTDINDIRNSTGNLSQKLRIGLHSGELIKRFSQENYSKNIALSTIRNAFEVLKAIDILEQT
jgi:hypothetical protein